MSRFNHVPVTLPQVKATTTNGVRLYKTPDGNLYPSITTVLSLRKKENIRVRQPLESISIWLSRSIVKSDLLVDFIKVEIKELDNGEIVKQEVVECADGRKAYDGPSYWELFAQFYYRDMFTPAYCRYYERPNHAYHKPGKVCLDKDGNWEVRK